MTEITSKSKMKILTRRTSLAEATPTLSSVTMPVSTFDPKTFFVAQSVCRLTSYDKFGNEREGSGFLATLRQPLRNKNRYGIVTNSCVFVGADGRSYDDIGAQPTVLIDAHFTAHTHQHTMPLVIKRDIVKWFVSPTLDLIFLEFRQDAEFLRRKSYNFLPLSNEPACEDQRVMIFRYPTKDNKTARCGYGKVVSLSDDGHIKWDHSVPNLPAGTPLIVADTLKVIGVHQTDKSNNNGDKNISYDLAIAVKVFLSEMQNKGFLDDKSIITSKSAVKSHSTGDADNKEQQQQNRTYSFGSGTIGSLIKTVTHLRTVVSPNNHKDHPDLQLGSIRDSNVITDNLKDAICSILQKRSLSTTQLMSKSEHDIKKLFSEKEQMKAVMALKQEHDVKIKEQLEHDAANLHRAAKIGDITTAISILRDKTLLPPHRQWLAEHRDPCHFNNTPLIEAALYGHLNIVEFLVNECNVNVNARDEHELGSTAVHLAAAHGHLCVVAFLTDHTPSLVEAKNKNNDTPLNRAASHGHVKVVEFLVDQKRADLENRGDLGRTALLQAAAWGHLNVVDFLMKRGANFFAKDAETESMASHLAAYFAHAHVVNFLFDRYPDLFSLRNKNGKTPLARARAQHKINVVRLLEARGARE